MTQAALTILVENTAQGHGLLAEHGISFWIEIGPRRILFDAGQTDVAAHNARLLDIDLSSMHAVVLSHGHYDHTGGLAGIPRSKTWRKKGVVAYAHPQALEDKYARNADGTGRYIGMAVDSRKVLTESFELRTTDAPTEVAEGLMVTGPIPRVTDFEDTGGPFFKDAECRQPDDLIDDQAAFLETSAGTVVILGCAHAGIVNTLRYIMQLAPDRPIATVIGGTHLIAASETRMNKTVEALRAMGIQRLFPLHCTGFQAAARLWKEFPRRVRACPVGTRVELSA
jgi:7,8-dihydropterin-6-yl-methyl-4-(beta-D-ribofuranosyl)aminobenzene 5'-phosphate synthase